MYTVYMQKSHVILGHRVHFGLTGVVIYERLSKGLAHYSAFIEYGSKWYSLYIYIYIYINDSQVHLHMQTSHNIMYQV